MKADQPPILGKHHHKVRLVEVGKQEEKKNKRVLAATAENSKVQFGSSDSTNLATCGVGEGMCMGAGGGFAFIFF